MRNQRQMLMELLIVVQVRLRMVIHALLHAIVAFIWKELQLLLVVMLALLLLRVNLAQYQHAQVYFVFFFVKIKSGKSFMQRLLSSLVQFTCSFVFIYHNF